MCGIFAIILKHSHDNNEHLFDYNILKHFKYGNKRGPEDSVIEHVNPNIIFGFHRLCINGLDKISNQPIKTENSVLICNGEIYNYKQLAKQFNITLNTNSDCEIIVKLYELMGTSFVNLLDGVFAFVIYDHKQDKIIIGRDPYGVRPLYICYYHNENIGFASDLQPLMFDQNIDQVKQYEPGTIAVYAYHEQNKAYEIFHHEQYFFNISYITEYEKPIEYYMYGIVIRLKQAVSKRVDNCEREIASLLSGGVDSSLISALVCQEYFNKTGKRLKTYSIGLERGVDLDYAEMVADYIGSDHTTVIATNDEFISSIKDVVQDVESYDTTTVRASVGNWNIAKYIKENSDAKVVFNGDGADELMGGYMYFHCAKNDQEFHDETLRLLANISKFDVLRSDKCISSHGLEPRTPFLDKEFTKFYISIPIKYRNHQNIGGREKYLIRKAFEVYCSDLLPTAVLWRKKEAFSDGVSSQETAWYQIIQENLLVNAVQEDICCQHNPPQTKEQIYYRKLFSQYYRSCDTLIPYYWMPKFIDGVVDASARTLNVYKDELIK